MSDAVIDPELGVPRAVVTESGGEVSASVVRKRVARVCVYCTCHGAPPPSVRECRVCVY